MRVLSRIRPFRVVPGYCSKCGGPAEQIRNGAWWHLVTSCRLGNDDSGDAPQFVPKTKGKHEKDTD